MEVVHIWPCLFGAFLCKKVLADKNIGITNGEAFVPPIGWNMNLSCTGGDDDLVSTNKHSSLEDNEEEEDFFN